MTPMKTPQVHPEHAGCDHKRPHWEGQGERRGQQKHEGIQLLKPAPDFLDPGSLHCLFQQWASCASSEVIKDERAQG